MDLSRKANFKCHEYFLGKFHSFIVLILFNLIIKIPSLNCQFVVIVTTFFVDNIFSISIIL